MAAVLRTAAAGAVSLTAFGQSLRGGDEFTFLSQADIIAGTPFASSEWADAFTGSLHEFVFALQLGAFDSPEFALRVTQIGIAVAGLGLLAAAVYDLAGPRAAMIAAWVLALEPTSVFFSGILYKESLMLLAEGLVALGAARIWTRGDLRSLIPILAGCLVAVATRPYAGWFLIAASAAVILHAGLRSRRREEVRSLSLVALVVLFGAISAPTILGASTDESLEENVQASQDANASDDANLSLERVDFSTRGQIVLSLPQRIRDVILRPYPWQLANPSQQLGAIGALFAIVVLIELIRLLVANKGRIMARAGPLVYVGFFILIAYSLSTGNAGTGFRYRTHILVVTICAIVVLREELALRAQPARAGAPKIAGARPAIAGSR